VPLHPLVVDELRAQRGVRRGPVVTRPDGSRGHCQPWTISHVANRYLHGIGIPDTLHSLRHRFGTAVYRASRDLRLTQELLGHSTPIMTALYAAHDPTQAAATVASLRLGAT
jgi:integrase